MPVYLVITLLTSLLCLLIANLPGLTFILVIFWGTSLVLGAYYLQTWQLLSIYAFNLALLVIFSSYTGVFFYFSFFGAAVLTMSYLATSTSDYYRMQKVGTLTAILGVSLFLSLMLVETGDIGVEHMETELNSYMEKTFSMYEERGWLDFNEQSGVSIADIEQQFYGMVQTMARHLPAFYYFQALMAVFLILLLATYLSQKYRIGRLTKKPFDQEIMPWQLVWVVITGLGLWLWGRELMSNLYYIGSNILALMTSISIYYGLAAIVFKLKQQIPNTRRLIIMALVLLSIVFPGSAVIFLALIGMFDSLLDYRNLRSAKEDV